MKMRYILLICLLSLIVNGLSIYNIAYGAFSIFLMVGVFGIYLPKKAFENVKKVSENGQSPFSGSATEVIKYTSRPQTKRMNRWSIYLGTIFIAIVLVFVTIMQIIFRDKFGQLIDKIFPSGNYDLVATVLSGLGYVLFILAVILLLIELVRLVKTDEMFND
ncbi:hypothetical protein ACFO4N_16625 [Camelliibacillus cellulosilyticus]|uniref:Uncharacterized protein n=1 Tax=Camelliibacillus cellulosilyticus TaxID=2174486 RepID=A0ABV9GT35_9BACL